MWQKALAFCRGSYRENKPAFALALLGTLGLALAIWFAVLNKAGWGLDFNQFYAAGRLAGSGHLYDWEALQKIERENGRPVMTGRLPVVLYGYKIFAGVTYHVARLTWSLCGIAALIVFAGVWPGTRRPLMMLALAWSLPATLLVLYGQDSTFWLMFFAAGLAFMDRKKPWSAGVMLALCICKFHLVLGIPVMLVAQKRWRTSMAGAITVVVLIASCFLIEGPGWPVEYWKMTRMGTFSPAPERMPTVRGIVSWFPRAAATEIVCAAAIVLLLWVACRGSRDLGMSGAAAAACGLLLGHHAYANDCALLIPLSVLTLQRQTKPPWVKAWALLMLTPVPVLLLVSPEPYLGQAIVVAFVVAAVWAGRPGPFGSARPVAAIALESRPAPAS